MFAKKGLQHETLHIKTDIPHPHVALSKAADTFSRWPVYIKKGISLAAIAGAGMTDFSRIYSSSPVNATAAKVVSKGIQWTPAKKLVQDWMVRNENSLPVKSFEGPVSENLCGKKFGRFTVIGKSAVVKSNAKGVAWVSRCDCGSFEIRRTSSLKRAPLDRLCCSHCDYLNQMKKGLVPAPDLQQQQLRGQG